MSALLCRFSAVLFLLILWIDNIGAKEVRIVCYYTNWSVYRPGDAKFNPQNINPYLCTHLIYAFGGFTKENTLKPFDKYQDIEKGGYAKFVGLKTYNKNLKTLLAIGGWNEGSTRFSPMVASTDRRKELIKNTIKFLRQNHFDGLDLDWEYPSFRDGGKPRDRDNYAQLVQELREEFERESEKTGRPRLLLTMAVPAGIEYIKKGYDVPKLTKYLDWMNILSYDYHSAYEPAVNHHSPLYPIEEESEYSYDIDLNIDYTIKHYIQSGADKSKLVLGIPTYGRSYTLYNPDANEIGAPADGPGEMGDATRENGYLAYYEICENIKSADWQVESPFPDMMGPYAYKDDQWVSYDDEDIARRKSEYVAEHGLGGIMFWSIDNDDFRGKCGDRPYPIIEAAKEALLKAYGLSDSNLLEATKKPIKSRTRSRTRGTTKALSTTEAAIVSNSGGRQTLRRKPHRISGKSDINTTKRRRRPSARKTITSTTTTEGRLVGSSLLVTPSYTTPSPPSTPDSGGDFKCEDEGFFPHPKDCKKYFWCLSGPSDLGIIAHQFTCPAGLYFNKAASSCDYTQNVLCNKKISKSSTKTTTAASSTSTTTSTSSSIFSTRRPPPKITAATSRTTFTSTTAAPEYEEEYEYYDEDEDDSPSNDAEEDPRVIKELIDLIKKAGGLDELEKQLKLQDEKQSTVNEGSTTQGSLSKSLFQRVLGRTTLRNTLGKTTPRYDVINRNSRGPQTNGIAKSSEEKIRSKSRPEYTSIIRSRPSTVATTGEDDDNINEERTKQDVKENTTEDTDLSNETDEDDAKQSRVPYRKSQPEYVTIRRQRISTTTAGVPEEKEEEETGRSFSRSPFKQLGEDNEFVEDTEENDKIVRNTLRSSTTSTPYVTIRRSRPTTTATDTIDEQIDNSGIRKRGNGTLNNETTSNPSSGFEYVTVRRQTPEVEPTTSKYVEIRTRGTTTAFPATDSEASNTEPPPTTITQLRSTTVTTEKELTTLSVDEIVVLDDSSSNNTNSEIDTSNLVEENRVESISNEVTENAKTDDKRNDVLEIVNIDKVASNTEKPNEQITTTIATPNEESVTYKRRGTQAPRPAFHLRRTTVAPVTTTAETPTTLSTSKVSLTPPRNFFRKKGFGSRDLLINRDQVNKIADNSANKENSVIDFEAKAQYDDTSEDQYSSRKRFRNSISLEKAIDNSYEGENNSKEKTENSDYKNRLRNRGRSRFTLQTIGTTATPRPRIRVVTDGPEEDYDTTEYIRKYRPDISYEIADLSSLTAVDLKDVSKGRRNGHSRRRRPTVQVIDSTTASSISTSTEPPLKTGSRTVPLARKFLENTAFDKSRRIRPSTANTPPTTQGTITATTNNEGQATQKRYISRIKTPFDRADIPNNASTQSISSNNVTEAPIPKLLKFRKFTPSPGQSTSTTNKPESIPLENSSTTRKPLGTRRRKILRRLKQRPTTTTTERISSSLDYVRTTFLSEITERSSTLEIHNASGTPATEDNPNINIITKTELLDLNENQTVTENLLTTITPVSENNVNTEKNDIGSKNEDDGNTTETGDEKSKDDLDSKSNEEDDEEEGENIKLSESIVRENSQIGDFSNRNVINGFDKSGSKLSTSYRTGLNNDKVDNVRFSKRPATEPNIIIRTRKIIRKLNPTETPESDEAGNKKVRKVVRRLRPSFPLNQIESEKTQERENTGGYSARRRFGFNRQSSPATKTNNDKEGSDNIASSKPFLSKRRYSALNRKGITENIEKSKSEGLKIDKGINKSIYSRIRTTTTTTTTTTEAPTTTTQVTSDDDDALTLSMSTTESSTSNNYEITKSIYENYSTDISTEGDSDTKDSENTTDLSTENAILTNTADFTSSIDDNRSTSKFEDFVSSTQQEYGTTNLFEESNKNQTTTISESTEYTNDMKSTTPLINIVTEEDTTSTSIDDSSVVINEEITTQYNEGSFTDMNTNMDEATAAIVKTTTALPTTKRIVSTTESPLSKLIKRRRFGSNTNTSESQDDGRNEDEERSRFASLNTRLRLRKFGKNTTERSLTKETRNQTESGKYTTQESQEGISLEFTSVRATSTESTGISTVSSIDDETDIYSTEYSTAGVEAETVDTTFDGEKVSTETFTDENINEENLSEITNTGVSDVTLSTLESISKDNISITETLSISSTEAAISSDSPTSSNTINTTGAGFTTDEYEDTESQTEITTEAIITTTTTRRPNRLFRPINARPKYTVRYRPSESTSAVPSTADSSIKSYSRYKLRTRNRNRFTFSSTTERYDENEELGYGPVKEFKSTLRVNSKIRGRDEFYESRKIEEEEEYTDDNEEESYNVRNEGEDDKDEEEDIANIRSSIYNRPYPYKPISPVLQKPATFTKTEEKEFDDFDADRNEENLDDPIDHIKDDNDDARETYLYRPQSAVSPATRASNAPIGVVSQKPVTRTYKGFRSTTPASVVQDLSDINITAINERNRNLFTKTRKQNVPVAYLGNSDTKRVSNVTQNTSQFDYFENNGTHHSSNGSTYSILYYQSNVSSSTESLHAEFGSTVGDNVTNENNLLQTESPILGTTEAVTTLTFDTPKIEDTTEELKSTEITQISTTLLPDIDVEEKETSEEFKSTEVAKVSSTPLPLNITNEKNTTEELKSTQITEKSSTLLHIFAETEAPITETTMSINDTGASRKGNKKLEKLIEINRVIEVHAEEGFKNRTGVVGSKTVIKEPIIDKIGLVSRITEIKIVEDKNSTTNQSATTSDQQLSRENKKYEGKTDYNFNIPIVSSADITQINQIHIDSASAVNKITPKPFYKAETSTIPLEGLFQTDSPLKYHHNLKSDSPNEILEGEHSRFVNVRILEQDITDRNAKPNYEAKFIPIKLLRDEEEITMKADVVEVTPESRHRTIKIAPIKVTLEGNV